MLDGIGKDISPTLAILLRVLPAAYHYRFRTIQFIDSVDDSIQAFILLYLFCVDVEEVLLDRRLWRDTHHDDTCLLIWVALPKDAS
jgi:hypothetical protein